MQKFSGFLKRSSLLTNYKNSCLSRFELIMKNSKINVKTPQTYVC